MLDPWLGNFSFPQATVMGGIVEVLISGLTECDSIWRWGLQTRNQGSVRSLGQAQLQSDWCPYEKRLGHRQAQGEDHARTQGGEGHLQAKQRGLRKTNSDSTFLLDFQLPELG